MASCPESLRDVLSEKELMWLAGELAFQRGRELSVAQKIEFSRAGATHLQSIVTETTSFSVDIHLLHNGDIHYSCDCASGKMELFCAHCVASSLAWLSEKYDATDLWSDAMSAMDEIDEVESVTRQLRTCFLQMGRDELIDTLVEWANRDPLYAQDLLNSQRFAQFG